MAKPNQVSTLNDEQEYRQVRKDLIFVIVMNLSFLAIILALFFVNHSNGSVDKFFAHLLKF